MLKCEHCIVAGQCFLVKGPHASQAGLKVLEDNLELLILLLCLPSCHRQCQYTVYGNPGPSAPGKFPPTDHSPTTNSPKSLATTFHFARQEGTKVFVSLFSSRFYFTFVYLFSGEGGGTRGSQRKETVQEKDRLFVRSFSSVSNSQINTQRL